MSGDVFLPVKENLICMDFDVMGWPGQDLVSNPESYLHRLVVLSKEDALSNLTFYSRRPDLMGQAEEAFCLVLNSVS